jgi:hypothetical protein
MLLVKEEVKSGALGSAFFFGVREIFGKWVQRKLRILHTTSGERCDESATIPQN